MYSRTLFTLLLLSLLGACTWDALPGGASTPPPDHALAFPPDDSVAPGDDDPHMTGLAPFTRKEQELQDQHQLRVSSVRLNELGLARVNAARASKGLPAYLVDTAPLGGEVHGTVGGAQLVVPEGDMDEGAEVPAAVLPGSVDNSTLKYFPPIRSQGSLPSCAAFSGTYYVMTYMWALANDLDAKAGGDTLRLSPKFTYNFLNGGEQVGTWYYYAYNIGQKHGVVTWADFPYDSNYRAWPLGGAAYRNAIGRRFDTYGYVNATDTDAGMVQVKQLLVDGYVLNIPTYIYSWQYKTIGDDPATPEDDAFAGKSAAYWVNGGDGYHAMTVVGYNDHIWVDINGNGAVDAGEKGAFRIANSWGTGWGEAGYRWMAYDALRGVSAVSGGPSTGRVLGWSPARAHWVTARHNYAPKVVAEFTLNHLKRSQLRMVVGISDTTKTMPVSTWSPSYVLSYAGGAYAFDGTTTAVDGTFVFDVTDLVPTVPGVWRYYVGMSDSLYGDAATLKSCKLINVASGNAETVCGVTPQTADGAAVYAYGDLDASNNAPAILSFLPPTPANMIAGATQTFSVDAFDADGDALTYVWQLDGTTLPVGGNAVTYSPGGPDIGVHAIEVTVSDDSGGTATQTWAVSVTGPPQPPTVAITSPSDGATYNALSNIVINVTASDVDSPIAKVELYQGAVKLGEDLTSPYSFTWSKVNVGTYVLSAKAIDSGGLATVSAPVTVHVLPVVTLSVYDAWASEPTTDTGRFKISRTGATTAALTVQYGMSGTAVNGTDYQSLAGTATIAAGATYVYVYVTPKDDALVEAKESAVMTLVADTAYVLGTTKTGTVNLLDNEVPVVTLSVYDAWASEPTTDTGRFKISRTGSTAASLAVAYAMSGTAVNGTDYQSLASTATIAAGATYVYVDVTPMDDTAVENKETVVMTVSQSAAYQTGSTISGTVNLLDNEMPIVTVAATDAVAAEPAETGTFTITRSGKTDVAVTVSYALSGTAAKGTDYATPSGTVTLASGITSTTVTISPIDDTAAENRETVTLGISANAAYQTSSVASATLYLYDDEKPYVTVAVTDSAAAEAGSDPGKYTITCSPAPKNATTIAYTMSGVATNGTDYVTLPGSVTVPAGQTTALITLTPVDDGIDEVTESAKLTLAVGTTYQVGSPSYATVNITDND